MRLLWPTAVISALTLSVSLVTARQDPPASPQTPVAVPAGPIPVEASNLLTHSPLVNCDADDTPSAENSTRLRVATWNIQAARASSVQAIADEVHAMQADVIALQEVDVRVRRTGFVDEPVALAGALGFEYVFAASIKWDQGDYGLAVLSRWPLSDARRHRLDATGASEPRIALDVSVCVGGRALHLLNHHADNRAASRTTNFVELKNIVAPEVGQGIVVLGDFNERPGGVGVRGLLDAGLFDLLTLGEDGSPAPGFRLDYLMADSPLARRISNAQVWRTDKSDHNAVFADLTW